jgi:hypothetical protein
MVPPVTRFATFRLNYITILGLRLILVAFFALLWIAEIDRWSLWVGSDPAKRDMFVKFNSNDSSCGTDERDSFRTVSTSFKVAGVYNPVISDSDLTWVRVAAESTNRDYQRNS